MIDGQTVDEVMGRCCWLLFGAVLCFKADACIQMSSLGFVCDESAYIKCI